MGWFHSSLQLPFDSNINDWLILGKEILGQDSNMHRSIKALRLFVPIHTLDITSLLSVSVHLSKTL